MAAKAHSAGTSDATDFSAHRHVRRYYRHHGNHRSHSLPYYYDRPVYYRPYPYSSPAPFTFGNSARNMLFGPGQMIIDMSVLKDFRFGENHFLQFRAEAFNMPNHPSFSAPAANISVPASVGRITSTSVPARSVQFGLKLVF